MTGRHHCHWGSNLKFPPIVSQGRKPSSLPLPQPLPQPDLELPTHPICVFPLASRVLRAAICVTVSLGQRSRFFSTQGSAVTICGASISHTRTPRSPRFGALSCRWGVPCRDSGSVLNGCLTGPYCSILFPPKAPTRQATAVRCRATLWLGKLANSSVSPWAAW